MRVRSIVVAMVRRSPLPWLALALALLHGCAGSAPYVWVDDLSLEAWEPEADGVYRIAPRDVISVRVWNQDSMSVERARVRDDEQISLPFLHDVAVAGLTPTEVSERLQEALVSFIVTPVVTVTLVEPAPVQVSVLGEVGQPGSFTLARPAGLLHAIAAAGGLTEYADRDGIYVLRRLDPKSRFPVRIRFRYRDLTGGGTPAGAFLLQSGDVIVVE